MTRDSYEMKPNRPVRGNSFFGGNPQVQLRAALQTNEINTFKKIIRAGVADLEHVYEYPDFKTCLEIAISELNKLEFVKYLLEQRVEINRINKTHTQAPIHFAVDNGNIRALQALLEDDRLDINVQSDGDTALLMAIKKMEDLDNDREHELIIYENMIELLLKKGCDANCADPEGITPIYSASKQGLETVVTLIADYAKSPIDIDYYKDRRGKSARDFLKEAFPHLVNKFGTEETEMDVDKLFYLLNKEDEDDFIRGFTIMKEKNEHGSALTANNGANTLLQLATQKGMDKVVAILLQNEANPNFTFSGNPNKPIAIACQYGFDNILKMFMEVETTFDLGTADSLLQILIKGMRTYHKTPKANHKECLSLLLNSKYNVDVNHPDAKNNTALHYAARNGDHETVIKLLRNGACVGLRNKFNEPPLADISAKTLESYLDECIWTNGERPSDDNYEIHMKYKFLVYPNNSIENELCKPLMDNSNNNVKEFDSVLSPETDALLYMARNQDLRPLLKHPVITSFLYLKWQRISCLFAINITFYTLLCLSLLLYIILGYGVVKKQSDSIEALNVVTHIGAVIGLIVLVLRELFQFLVSPVRYLQSIENWMEIILICVTAAIVCDNTVDESTKKPLSAVAILLSSAELILLIGQHPALSTYIVMLKKVSWNFLKFLLWYCILIIAFALSFYTLFRQEPKEDQIAPNPNNTGNEEEEEEDFFEDPGRSLFKTIVMLTGEFDAGSIKFGAYPITSHLIFMVFVFMIPIVLFNLLNGLAVSDTQQIRANAELVGLISRVKLISYFESVLLGNVGSYSKPNSCWDWLPTSIQNLNLIKPQMFCLKPFANRISLFPNFLPQYKIIVKPNQDNKIEIPQAFQDTIRKYSSEEDIEGGGSCCYRNCQMYTLEPQIVKHSRAVINKKTTMTEFDEIKQKLSQYDAKLKNIETLLKKLLGSECNRI